MLEPNTTRAKQVSMDCGRHSGRLDLYRNVIFLQFYVRLHAKTHQRDTRKCSCLAPLLQCFTRIWHFSCVTVGRRQNRDVGK